MNKRLLQFLSAENISQTQFADTIHVARASVSHILAGRNKPGFDFLESMLRHYPNLNPEWLMTGNGRMYKTRFQEDFAPTPAQEMAETAAVTEINDLNEATQVTEEKPYITKILVFYSDGTFTEIS
ncbi:MAG: helix-turn-helix transcriptional regulator [Bacteroidales bacterium]|nr:helix-turn-helix transcriptional regulator [Bacteroidales bacterium]